METECRELLAWMAQTASEHGMEIQSCSEAVSLADIGIKAGKCIDDGLLNELWGIPLSRKDPGQRDACLCAVSKDIGANDTCLHGCRYCYATATAGAQARRRMHDPASPILVGQAPEPGAETVEELAQVQQKLF